MIAGQYGSFVDHLPSVLPLLAVAGALFACSTTGRTSRNNQRDRDASLANRDVRRVVVARLGSNRPSVSARRRPDLTKDH